MADKHHHSKEILKQIHIAAEYGCDGGDPIDKLGPWLDKTGITMDDVDRTVAEYYGNGQKNYGFHAWFSEMMDNLALDREHDQCAH